MNAIRLTLLILALGTAAGAHGLSQMSDDAKASAVSPLNEADARAIGEFFVDKIVVEKSERRLYLMKDGKPVRTYRVALGSRPEGHKQRRGDGRTPEGRYLIDWRNPNSNFYKSLHISYPNTWDRVRAERQGWDPGGMIMIHGQPPRNEHSELQDALRDEDWTQGCIAVSNLAIEEIWELTPDGTPIEILP